MSQRFRLVGLRNTELLSGLTELVAHGNALTADLLAHLAEVERRLLHAELGFPSLHAYCVQGLKMSEGAAGRRVIAARVCRRFPEAFERVACGDLHLSALCAPGAHLTDANAPELLHACVGKTRRQTDQLLAEHFPSADVREQVRRLAGREIEPLSAERFGVRFTADSELRDLIERARDLTRHKLPAGDLAGLVKLALKALVQSEEKRRFGVGSRPLKDSRTPPGGAVRRQAAVAVRREVYARDGKQCSFVASDGKRCDARGWLEIDHVQPWARNGASNAENLRLRCRAHNLLHARECFGTLHVTAKVAARRREAPP